MIYWNADAAQYKRQDGSIITEAELLSYVEQSLQAAHDAPMMRLSDGSASIGTKALGTLVATGLIPVGRGRVLRQVITSFYDQLFEQTKREIITLYLEGKGGRDAMTAEDWGSCGGMLADQLRYAKPFAQQVADGLLSEAQIQARAAMYVNSAREAYHRGKARALGVPLDRLPALPADGQTRCLTNCRCSWRFEPVYNDAGDLVGWECYWEINPAEHCDDCLANHETWYPLFIEV